MPSDSRGAGEVELVREATSAWHYDWDGRESGDTNPHGSFTDACAHTHCICWGAAQRMLDHLRALPVEERMAAVGMHRTNLIWMGRPTYAEVVL